MSKKLKRQLKRIIIAAAVFIAALCIYYFYKPAGVILYLVAYILAGYDVINKAVKGVLKKAFLDENFLMSVASIGAIFLGEFSESVLVMLLYQIGEWFQSYAVSKSRKSIASLLAIRPDTAAVLRDGQKVTVTPENVAVGEILEVRAGERIPLDGVVIQGVSQIDTAALTGESLPIEVYEGSTVFSGCINLTGVLLVKVSKTYQNSTAAKILDLVENSSAKKAKSENFIKKFARYYTPIVVFSALMLALIPSLILGNAALWIKRALTFLVVSCPCALVISVPLSYFGGIGSASREGVLIKGSEYLESLSICDTVVFDKTGTLTKGILQVDTVYSQNLKSSDLLSIVASAEKYSNHPLGLAVCESVKDNTKQSVTNIKEIAGYGITCEIDRKKVLIGSKKLLFENGLYITDEVTATALFVAIDGEFEGYITFSDTIREEAKETVGLLEKCGIKRTLMLSGDKTEAVQNVANQVGIKEYYGELLPDGKVKKLEEILAKAKGKVAFMGDGINDAPVLTRADIGIAVGGLGSDAAIEAADVVIMDDNLKKLGIAIKTAKKTSVIVKQNIIFAIGVKVLFLVLGAFGISGMLGAIFADVGVTFIAILNAMRGI